MAMRLAQNDEWDKGLDEEILSKLMELRTYLETRLKALEEESERLRTLSKIVEEVVISKSFRVAETLQPVPTKKVASTPPSEPAESIPLKTSQGVLLADMFVTPPNVRIVPVEALTFSTNTPPFQTFFITRILESMKVKDDEAVRQGQFLPEDALSYDVVTEEDVIREIAVRNYGDERRLMEIKSTCRWTLEKMYERIHLSE
jgi:hypothetical protein